jgi:imidazolonepropionase-like amidohydrolase
MQIGTGQDWLIDARRESKGERMVFNARVTGLAVLAAVAGLALGCAGAPSDDPAPSLAFTNVTVVPMDSERTLPDHTVVVRGDRITDVGPAATIAVPDGATLVDGTGKFLMPGMAEMHAHVPVSDDQAYVERMLALFVANGVTTIRGMLGHPSHLALRDRVAAGEIVAPVFYTSGPSFNGNSVTSPDVGVRMVREQQAAGYDLLKIHPGVSREAFDAVAEEAGRVGMSFAGHVPADVGLARAIEAGYASIDHIDGFFEYARRDDAPVSLEEAGFFGANLAAHLDPDKLARAVRMTKDAGVWIVPTHGLMQIFMSDATPEDAARWPGVEYMPAAMVEQWQKQRASFQANPDLTPEVRERFLAERRTLLKMLHDAGVDIAMGSDAVQVFSVPGFSIVGEMREMAASGLTPYEVYVTGSRNVARYFGREAGTVEAGRIADLVLVDANPLDTVENFARQTGTMVGGRWHERQALLERFRP